MHKVKNLWVGLFIATVISIILSWPAAHRCEHCGKPALWEAVLAHLVGDSHAMVCMGNDPVTMIHLGCIKEWLKDHPLEFDEDGRLINVYDPRHSSNK